jgi:hypothetical protein
MASASAALDAQSASAALVRVMACFKRARVNKGIVFNSAGDS